MRKMWSNWVVVMAFLVVSNAAITESRAQGSISLQVFYDELQPYGTWINDNRYGYVWMPGVDQGFVPYGTNGYWVNTAYGNTWVSDYSWGWAPFHYGRWFYDDFYGWLWVPDTTWAPAWVAWRSGGGYYGWAPLMPGFGISVSAGYYSHIPHNYWNFVPYRYVMYRHVYTHCLPRPQVVNVINHTTVVVHNHNGGGRDRSYFTGPTRREIETRNRERVPVYDINDRSRPGRTEVSRSSVSLYRPEVDNSTSVRSRAIPKVIGDERNVTRQLESRNGRSTLQDNLTPQRNREFSTQQMTESNRTLPVDRNANRGMNNDVNNMRRDQQMDRLERQRKTEQTERSNTFDRMQNDRNADRLQQKNNVERMQSQRPAQGIQRSQSFERQQPQKMERQQLQRSEPTRGLEQPRSTGSPRQHERQFSPEQTRQRPSVNPAQSRSSAPHLQRQEVQRNNIPQKSRSFKRDE